VCDKSFGGALRFSSTIMKLMILLVVTLNLGIREVPLDTVVQFSGAGIFGEGLLFPRRAMLAIFCVIRSACFFGTNDHKHRKD